MIKSNVLTQFDLLVIVFFNFQRIPPLRIENLIEDLKDGTRLLALLEVLSGERLVSNLLVKNYHKKAAVGRRMFIQKCLPSKFAENKVTFS